MHFARLGTQIKLCNFHLFFEIDNVFSRSGINPRGIDLRGINKMCLIGQREGRKGRWIVDTRKE